MKKFISVALAFLFVTSSLTACNGSSNTPDENSDSLSCAEKKKAYLDACQIYMFDESEPYKLIFESNGDGTCKVTDIIYNFNFFVKQNLPFNRKYFVEIPEKSPEGDTVISVDRFKNDHTAKELLPDFILEDVYKKAYNYALENFGEDKTRCFEAFFVKKDITDPSLSEKTMKKMLDEFPVLNYFSSIYAIDKSMNIPEFFLVCKLGGWNPITIWESFGIFERDSCMKQVPKDLIEKNRPQFGGFEIACYYQYPSTVIAENLQFNGESIILSSNINLHELRDDLINNHYIFYEGEYSESEADYFIDHYPESRIFWYTETAPAEKLKYMHWIWRWEENKPRSWNVVNW